MDDQKYSTTLDTKGRIWITDDLTIWRIDKAALLAGNFEARLMHRVQLGGVSKLFIDRAGLLWIGTNGFGIYQHNIFNENFNKTYVDGSVVKVHKDGLNRLWAKCVNAPFAVFDEENQPVEIQTSFLPEDSEVLAMANGLSKNILWFLINFCSFSSLDIFLIFLIPFFGV